VQLGSASTKNENINEIDFHMLKLELLDEKTKKTGRKGGF
jgi:hypothetical protein